MKIKFISVTILTFLLYQCNEPEQIIEEDKIPKTAKVTTSGLKLRMQPNTTAAEISRLKHKSEVRIIRRSIEKDKIGSMDAHWYQVKTKMGLTGWVYGAYLDAESQSNEPSEKQQKKIEKELRQELLGRWYAVTKTGKMLSIFITFFEDNTIEMGYSQSVSQFADYELKFNQTKLKVKLFREKKTKDGIKKKKIKKAMLKKIKAELIGATFKLTAKYGKYKYSFKLTEKEPESFSKWKQKQLENFRKKKKV